MHPSTARASRVGVRSFPSAEPPDDAELEVVVDQAGIDPPEQVEPCFERHGDRREFGDVAMELAVLAAFGIVLMAFAAVMLRRAVT